MLKQIESLAEMLVLCDPADVASVFFLREELRELTRRATAETRKDIADFSRKAADLIEADQAKQSTKAQGTQDHTNVLQVVSQGMGVLQSSIAQNRPMQQSDLPQELQDKSNDSNAIAASAAALAGGIAPCLPPPDSTDRGLLAEFLSHQGRALDDIEGLLLDIEKAPDKSKTDAILRILHTLKGDAGVLGLTEVEMLCHEAEDVIGKHAPAVWVERLFSLKDWLTRAFAFFSGKGPAAESASEWTKQENTKVDGSEISTHGSTAVASDKSAVAASTSAPVAAAQVSSVAIEVSESMPVSPSSSSASASSPAVAAVSSSAKIAAVEVPQFYTLSTDPGELEMMGEFIAEAKEHLESADVHLLALETDPLNDDAINAVFRCFHTIKGVAGCLNVPVVPGLAHYAENLLDRCRKGQMRLEGQVIDVTFDSVDLLKRAVNQVSTALSTQQPMPYDPDVTKLQERLKAIAEGRPTAAESAPVKKLGEILVDRGVVKPAAMEEAVRRQEEIQSEVKLGEQLVRDGQASAKEVVQALRTQKEAVASDQQQGAVQVKETIKVDTDRLDRLVDMIGELVIAESMVSQSAELRQGASVDMLRHISQLDKLTRALQEIGTSLRMVPMRPVFQKMARLVRDLSKKIGKPVEFVMTGEDTELDKTVVEKIGDPLVHMVRNAVDHGLEANVEDRRKAGKSEIGRVELSAYHKGGNIYIEVTDDGRGLDKDIILAKARERGLVKEGEVLADREIYNLVLLPGFSTAKVVTDVSGRGVGMDVVKRNIESLRGQIDIRTEKGKGSTFSLRLPLTLAVIDGMVLGVGRERYIIPTLSICRSIRPEQKDIISVLQRGEMLSLQGKLFPLFRLERLFDVADAVREATEALVVVVENEGQQVGLLVDKLFGQQQIVIKSLGEGMQGLPGISGGAIMPDGQVGLILDVSGLVKLAQSSVAKSANEQALVSVK